MLQKRGLTGLCILQIALVVQVSFSTYIPPVYEIKAATLYDAGLQQGRMASHHIKAWLASPEMTNTCGFAKGKGHKAFEQLKRDNSKEFPQYVEEMRGIADGAGLELDQIWCFNLIAALEALMKPSGTNTRSGHCSDIYAISEGGYDKGFAHGHNEDWGGSIKELWYFVKYSALPGANFSSCAGMVYPGTLMGWTPVWNAHGMYQTQNSLFPRKSKAGGLTDVFIQREAICGQTGGTGIDAVLKKLSRKGWSVGASVNVVDLNSRRMANIETHEDQHAVQEVTEMMGNYSHFNMYKELQPGLTDESNPSTVHRQARIDQLPASRSAEDIRRRLSDTADKDYPVFRNMTVGTFVLDGSSGVYRVWHDIPSASGPEIYKWNLKTFFEDDIAHTSPDTMVV